MTPSRMRSTRRARARSRPHASPIRMSSTSWRCANSPPSTWKSTASSPVKVFRRRRWTSSPPRRKPCSAPGRARKRSNTAASTAGTALCVQAMVYGNSGGTSGSGVAFTRDPATGENALYMDFMFNAQGEDVVSGRHELGDRTQIGALLPEVTQQIEALRKRLEAEFGDVQEFEFTVQNAQLFMLQTRTGKRTPLAALRIAVDMVAEGLLEPAAALQRLEGCKLRAIQTEAIRAKDGQAPLARAIP